jgi:hypothetical protein
MSRVLKRCLLLVLIMAIAARTIMKKQLYFSTFYLLALIFTTANANGQNKTDNRATKDLFTEQQNETNLLPIIATGKKANLVENSVEKIKKLKQILKEVIKKNDPTKKPYVKTAILAVAAAILLIGSGAYLYNPKQIVGSEDFLNKPLKYICEVPTIEEIFPDLKLDQLDHSDYNKQTIDKTLALNDNQNNTQLNNSLNVTALNLDQPNNNLKLKAPKNANSPEVPHKSSSPSDLNEQYPPLTIEEIFPAVPHKSSSPKGTDDDYSYITATMKWLGITGSIYGIGYGACKYFKKGNGQSFIDKICKFVVPAKQNNGENISQDGAGNQQQQAQDLQNNNLDNINNNQNIQGEQQAPQNNFVVDQQQHQQNEQNNNQGNILNQQQQQQVPVQQQQQQPQQQQQQAQNNNQNNINNDQGDILNQ